MLPGGFKKDSRSWLHKNSKKTIGVGEQGLLSDDPYEQLQDDPFMAPHNIIRDTNGRTFKKDSRTWLHKSSLKKVTKPTTNGTFRVPQTGLKVPSRQPRVNLDISGENMTVDGVIRTRSSTEMVRVQNGVNKLKKKKRVTGLGVNGCFAPTLDVSSVKETPSKVRSKQIVASLHCMGTPVHGKCEVSSYASDICIVGNTDSPPKVLHCSNSASDVGDEGERVMSADGVSRLPPPTFRVSDGGCVGVGYNSNHELTRDGLQELELMMEEQSRLRSLRMGKDHYSFDLEDLPLDVSPETLSSNSKIGLDATVDLSDEYVCARDVCHSQNSTDQLTTATECLHVRSPDQTTPPDQNASPRDV
ncbi:uncharacterized protein LOC131942125 [Physella acuta]|uniref:uncharacterized protein LOC131942125 n=1 Tax=Physella acuta TaxID=109671 RepID=UPI0027DE6DCB|nr:uncharacterized protein LOC131942125 [Physella acuta]